MNPSFWRDRRVFLTGHTGFKGSWLALWLRVLGARVTGFALPPPTNPSLFELAGVGHDMRSVLGDVRDAEALSRAMREADAEVVLHLAAQPLVRASYDAPLETFSTNVMGTANLLEAVRRSPGVRSVVIVTTDKCYENREQPWGYREADPLGGHDPYSSSKACTELVVSSFRASYFATAASGGHAAAIATARAGNVIGGGDWAAERLVPDLLAAFEAGVPATIRHPGAVRPWQHVLEPLRGYLELAERLHTGGQAYAEAWNFGPGEDDAQPVAWIADTLAGLWGRGASWQAPAGLHPHETHCLRLDSSKARARLGWRPAMRLPDALASVAEWALARKAGADLRTLTLDQISTYQDAVLA
jgi:CDP-glucose 4,6-dehydratase